MLDEVPPHLVPDQLVAEARRAGGVPVALYVVDIDGSQLVRLAGSEDFPAELDEPPALGPEIVPEGLPGFQRVCEVRFPAASSSRSGCAAACSGSCSASARPITPLDDIAKQGAAALELANDYTDFIEAARRRKPTTAAAEIQQNLFPPRIARIAGAQLAGGLLPTYEVGGDWFDFVENRDGAWLAIADAAGTGPTAAGLGAAALGALRAARRSGKQLEDALQSMDETVRRLGNPDFYVTALIARWHAATSTSPGSTAAIPPAYLIDADGHLRGARRPRRTSRSGAGKQRTRVPSSTPPARPGRAADPRHRRRHSTGGPRTAARSALDGIQRAVSDLEPHTAAATAMAILQAVSDCWREPLEDDGTVVVLSAL